MANEKIVNRENLKVFREKYDERLETGQIVPSKALTAKELETISPDSGDTQETPFALQGTGTANGTSSVDTGTVGKHIQKQGSVYCVNQLSDDNVSAVTIYGYTASITNGVVSITKNASGDWGNLLAFSTTLVNGHTYLFKCSAPSYANINLSTQANNPYYFSSNTITKLNATPSNKCLLRINSATSDTDWAVGTTITFRVQLIDLTQWFNGNIPQDLLDNQNHWSWYQTYGDYIAHNTGTLVSGNGKWLVTTGYNAFNGEIDIDSGYLQNNGQVSGSANYGISDFIKVISGQTYTIESVTGYNPSICFYDEKKNFISGTKYDLGSVGSKDVVVPDNALYCKISIYKPNIDTCCFHLTYDGSRTGYEPYEQPKVYDTGTETLLSTGVKLSVSGEREDIYDYKEPNGLITRRVGSYTFTGNESWTSFGSGYRSELLTSQPARTIQGTDIANAISDTGLLTIKTNDIYNGTSGIGVNANQIYISDTSNLTGKTIYFELATPTTEQGTPFSENIEIDDFGTMGWYSSYTDANTNALVSVPQGCKIFYPAWYVGFIDTLGQRADIDWNANNVVSQSELGVVDTKHDNLYAIMQENVGGALRHQISGVDFNNTAWVDLGSLSWGYDPTYKTFSAQPTNLKNGTTNVISSLYQKTTAWITDSAWANGDMLIRTNNQYIIIRNNGYTDATTFKNAMKGVLLAYEKA